MANRRHLAILQKGMLVWNAWREKHPDVRPDFSSADLSKVDLRFTNLGGANLSQASLMGVNLIGADLNHADLTNTLVGLTSFGDLDLSNVKGLDTVKHYTFSTIGIDTLIRSDGKIPEIFLRGCGVPDSIIEYLPSLIGAMQPIQFYSSFISHSSRDHDFAQRLYERMQSHHIRVWFADEDLKGGATLHEQIDQAIRIHDKLILVLSGDSIHSPWVETEIRKARKAELDDNRRKLFPIRLVDMDTLRNWECFDGDNDLAIEVREYYIPDFSRWKDHDSFEREFAKLLNALKATEAPPIPRAPSKPKNMPQEVEVVITAKKRRLGKLEEHQAKMGISTPPEVANEIEDLRAEIGRLEYL